MIDEIFVKFLILKFSRNVAWEMLWENSCRKIVKGRSVLYLDTSHLLSICFITEAIKIKILEVGSKRERKLLENPSFFTHLQLKSFNALVKLNEFVFSDSQSLIIPNLISIIIRQTSNKHTHTQRDLNI